MTELTLLDLGLYPVAGLAIGTVYFWLLHRTAQLLAAEAGARHIVPLYVLRIAFAVGAFWLIAQKGVWPLVLSLAGFVAGRFLVQLRLRVR